MIIEQALRIELITSPLLNQPDNLWFTRSEIYFLLWLCSCWDMNCRILAFILLISPSLSFFLSLSLINSFFNHLFCSFLLSISHAIFQVSLTFSLLFGTTKFREVELREFARVNSCAFPYKTNFVNCHSFVRHRRPSFTARQSDWIMPQKKKKKERKKNLIVESVRLNIYHIDQFFFNNIRLYREINAQISAQAQARFLFIEYWPWCRFHFFFFFYRHYITWIVLVWFCCLMAYQPSCVIQCQINYSRRTILVLFNS